MDNEVLKWKKRFERERASRKEAEKLLENKSYELFNLNESLKDRIEEEVEKNRKKEEFLAEQSKFASMNEILGNIAHQWRQPLSAITSCASGIQLQKELAILNDTDLEKGLNDIIERANYLSTTIDEFRNFFKTDSEKELFTINKVFDKIINIIDGSFRSSNIILIKDLKTNPECFGLKSELIQVILNILTNAKDIHTLKDTPSKYVKVEVKKENNFISIDICDNAGGIPEEIFPKIFEPYFTTKHQSQGTGIGLYMSKQLVANHFNGQLRAKNKEFEIDGKKYFGACFTVIFPANI